MDVHIYRALYTALYIWQGVTEWLNDALGLSLPFAGNSSELCQAAQARLHCERNVVQHVMIGAA